MVNLFTRSFEQFMQCLFKVGKNRLVINFLQVTEDRLGIAHLLFGQFAHHLYRRGSAATATAAFDVEGVVGNKQSKAEKDRE